MRRKRRTVREFVTDELTKKIGTLMDNRRRVLAPFPLVPEDLYRMAWTAEERQAIRLLARERRDMLREHKSMKITLREPLCVILITLANELPMPGFSLEIPYDNLTFEQAQALGEWAPRWLELSAQQASLIQHVKEVGGICKTYGQLHRLWPDMESFYNEAAKTVVRNARVKSPYPSEALLFNGATTLKPQYRPEVFAQFTSMIAECLMLPESEDREVAKVTR
jgi:hypothetical protein